MAEKEHWWREEPITAYPKEENSITEEPKENPINEKPKVDRNEAPHELQDP